MLALAPQPMHAPVDVPPHRTQPPTPGSSTRSTFRKVTPSYPFSSSVAGHSVHSGPSITHTVPPEPSSSRRATPQRTASFSVSARPSVYDGHEDDPSTPPGSEPEDNEAEPSLAPSPAAVDIHAYDSSTLLRLLASTLTEIASMNTDRDHADPFLSSPHQHGGPAEPHPPIWRTLTAASRHALSTASSLSFHARNVPTIALEAYLTRIQKYCPASNEVFLSLLVYFDRMMKLAKETCGKVFAIDMYNVHRLVIAGVTVASKFFSDVFYTNSRYAKVGGLPLTELNQLELQFLLLNDFHLMISQEEMQFYATKLVQQSQVPSGVSLIPFLPEISPSTPHDPRQSPIGPLKYFQAVDRYLAHLRARVHPTHAEHISLSHPPSYTPSHSRPSSEYRRSASSYSTSSASDSLTEGDTETEFDGETDDEPTIRAPHSSASASDADSICTDDSQSEMGEDAYHANGARGYHHRAMSP
ncbi:cyclin-domain-containing protein [Epithele typhae]|uniref:cyclin-domain-containing protein n=1 Tax=Epithele typhae TaxID=378194 RepID=UPI002008E8D5|nr:cyclin-domain-containing protein [Epithele typhae]KAH9921518.1 cyclin-domain-containing protein [Epithele typhae]